MVEAQLLSLAIHSQWMGGAVRTIHATGGASQNRAILQVMADVFAADVVPLASRNTAALGAALRAWHGAERARGRERPWKDIVPDAATPTGPVVRPDPRAVAIYRRMRAAYAACEAHALGHGADPTPLLSEFDRSA